LAWKCLYFTIFEGSSCWLRNYRREGIVFYPVEDNIPSSSGFHCCYEKSDVNLTVLFFSLAPFMMLSLSSLSCSFTTVNPDVYFFLFILVGIFWVSWIWGYICLCISIYLFDRFDTLHFVNLRHTACYFDTFTYCDCCCSSIYWHYIIVALHCCLYLLYCAVDFYGLFTAPCRFVLLNNINLISPLPHFY